MEAILKKIRRYAYQRRIRFTFHAEAQLSNEGLAVIQVIESLIYAERVRVKLSTSRSRQGQREKVYIIEGFTLDGVLIYTKGTFRRFEGEEELYLLISTKRSRRS